jgi:hypothetical protein
MNALLQGVLVIARRPHEPRAPLVTRPEPPEVLAGLRERQPLVRPAPHLVGVVVVLAIVLPETDSADVKTAARIERQVPAARARVRAAARRLVDVHKRLQDHASQRMSEDNL